jgi:hypothetical protein
VIPSLLPKNKDGLKSWLDIRQEADGNKAWHRQALDALDRDDIASAWRIAAMACAESIATSCVERMRKQGEPFDYDYVFRCLIVRERSAIEHLVAGLAANPLPSEPKQRADLFSGDATAERVATPASPSTPVADYRCPKCGAPNRVDPELLGQRNRCTSCNEEAYFSTRWSSARESAKKPSEVSLVQPAPETTTAVPSESQVGVATERLDLNQPFQPSLERPIMAIRRSDWYLGVAVVAAAIVIHSLFPRYDIRALDGAVGRVDRWSGHVEITRDEGTWFSIYRKPKPITEQQIDDIQRQLENPETLIDNAIRRTLRKRAEELRSREGTDGPAPVLTNEEIRQQATQELAEFERQKKDAAHSPSTTGSVKK